MVALSCHGMIGEDFQPVPLVDTQPGMNERDECMR